MAAYYIDYKNGNDTTGDGSSDAPWKTLTKALTAAGNSDTIIARGSAADPTTWYREYNVGISETNLTIQADAGHTPVWSSAHGYSTWSKTSGKTNVYEAAYTSATCSFVWNGATLLASAASVDACDAATNSYYFDDANNLLYVNIGGDPPTSIDAYDQANNWVFNVSGTGLTLSGLAFYHGFQALLIGAGGSTFTNCTFARWVSYNNTGSSFAMLRITGATHLLSGCTFSGGPLKQACVVGYTGSSAITIQDCTFDGGYRAVYHYAGTSGHVITRCTVANTTAQGLYCLGTTTVSYCTVHDCAAAQIYCGGADSVISHCTTYNATAADSYGICIVGATGGLIEYCTAYDCYRDGIYLENAAATIRYCTAKNCGHAGIWVGTGALAATVHHCTVYIDKEITSSPTDAIYGFVVDPSTTATVNFFHCLCANLLLATTLAQKAGWFLQNDGALTIQNCISYNNYTGYEAVASYTPTLTADYNLQYACNEGYYGDWSAGAHDLAADPLFIAPTSGNFNLQPLSPCIDAAIGIEGINETYIGLGPDIGPNEYQDRASPLALLPWLRPYLARHRRHAP